MQVQKEHIRGLILKAAEQAFLKTGFAKASMRDIAQLAGVGVANLYNYFPRGKDELFRHVVSPLLEEMERMVYQHHDEQYAERYIDFLCCGTPELMEQREQSQTCLDSAESRQEKTNSQLQEEQMRDYLALMRRHRPLMELLFFKAQGSSLENYMDDFTDRCTAQVVRFMQRAKALRPDIPAMATPFTYHLHTVWMFAMFCEIIKHRLAPDEAERVIRDYITFEYSGWRELVRRDQPR